VILETDQYLNVAICIVISIGTRSGLIEQKAVDVASGNVTNKLTVAPDRAKQKN
jgi:hypothetical protein